MITELTLPEIGANIKEAVILRWLKAEGSEVRQGEVIAELETEKANFEYEAAEGGVLRRILAQEGATVPVGATIAVVGAAEDDVSAYGPGDANGTASAVPASAPIEQRAPVDVAASAPSVEVVTPRLEVAVQERRPAANNANVHASPLARRLAEKLSVDLSQIRGSGIDGRILVRDVEAWVMPAFSRAAASPPGQSPSTLAARGRDHDTVPLSRMRQVIARRMTESKQTVPHYYLQIEVDMTQALRLRREQNERLGEQGRLTINDIIVLGVARALVQHPRFNAWFVDGQLQIKRDVNVCIAVSLEEGLVAPAIQDCAAKSLLAISAAARDIVARARNGDIHPEELTSGTFTISNLGNMGIQSLVAIINQPQVAILTAGSVEERAVVRDGSVLARPTMSMVLSADHRASDGAEGARFLQSARANLENPEIMLL
ncbi:MAG TPA: dihydrolipoamide acetyltransferase family protein [Dehalococcoidia bacterium]|nr:dihydrolipoamide acetyltransferase family protein [Dehalococcoidia bacterium]